MWCNGLVCIPLLTLYVVVSGELSAALAFPQLGEVQFQAVLAMSCVLAFALNYTIFMNTAVNSALTQTVRCCVGGVWGKAAPRWSELEL
jgi:solute carrier family 35 protein